MIQELVRRFDNNRENIKDSFRKKLPCSYGEILKVVINHVTADEYEDYALDPERIHCIDDGDYQGTLIFVIAEKGYQPYRYYYTGVSYGSCSGCDTLQDILYSDDYDEIAEDKIDSLFTIALHLLQGIHQMWDE